MNEAHSDAFVFLGASGDLAYKQIFPALQSMIKRGHLDVPVIGVAKSGWNLDKLRARAKDSLEKHGGLDQAAFAKLSSLLQYIDGDYADPGTFVELKEKLGAARRPLYYLAIPPNLFSTVSNSLAKAGCIDDARVVVEKPFGRDLASAKQLNKTLHEHFNEDSIFRIDHYLGKEPVQNLIYLRFANPIVSAAWSKEHIESVQITMAEKFDVADRGKLYDEEGAIRDVVQNHMLQLISCLGMECPENKSHSSVCNERARLIKSIRTLEPKDVVRGQFVGYHDQAGVAKDSTVETFAALKFEIDNDRWRGVPFYVRAGKCMPVTITEVMIRFKRPDHPVLDESSTDINGHFRFRLSPREQTALGTKVKKPGEKMIGETAELVLHEAPRNEMPPYERLLGDAMNGDATLFSREDSVEAAWRILDPILGNITPVYPYEKGTWGPPEVNEKIKPENGWHNPKPDGWHETVWAAEQKAKKPVNTGANRSTYQAR
jgi:glucose-6-phosphate 1-dehydrogenase